VARRFSLFRRPEPTESADAPETGDEGRAKGFGFVTMGTEDAAAVGDPDQPVIIGSLPNPPDSTGGTDVAVEGLTIAHEGFQPTESTPEIIELSHEIKSPPDAAAGGETIQIHGQYDMDTTVEGDSGAIRYGRSRGRGAIDSGPPLRGRGDFDRAGVSGWSF
jgi:hypothetical protein